MKRKALLVILLSFLTISTIGMILLSLPISYNAEIAAETNRSLFLVNAFTSISALSCTGLSIVNIADYYTAFGKLIILLLIQTGGIGIVTIFSWIVWLIGAQNSKTEKVVFSEMFELKKESRFSYFLLRVIRYTLFVEGVGAIIFFLLLIPSYGLRSIPLSIFHAISSFCNAGFTVFDGANLSEFYNHPPFLLVTALLIILGGIGFVSLVNIRETWKKTGHHFVSTYKQISNISRMVLQWTALLLCVGTIGILICELIKGNQMDLFNAFFLSASSRTAGFYTTELNALSFGSKFLIGLLMLIGGASGSTAGGIHINNITTIVYSRFNEKIPKNKVKKSKAVILLTTVCIAAIFILCALLEFDFGIDIAFEVISAFGTVGLSSIGTENLSSLTLLFLMFAMFIGKYSVSMLAYLIFYKPKKVH